MKYFDQVYLIGLPDRLEEAQDRLVRAGIFQAHLIRAFVGDHIGAPSWWRAGNGAWGCYTSHLHALHLAWQSGAETALVLEDDVIFTHDFQAKLDLCMENVPGDWGQVYLGGQLRGTNEQVNKWVIRPSRVNRTHAYAMTRSAIPSILRHLTEFPEIIKDANVFHIDHHYEEAHRARKWAVYAPAWWLCGQGPVRSMVNGREEWTRWWHNDVFAPELPLIVCPPGHPVTAGLHFGYHCEGTWCPFVAGRMHDLDQLRHRLMELKYEALRHNYLPAVSHSFLSMEMITRIDLPEKPLRPVAWCPETFAKLLTYPQNGLLPTPYYTVTRSAPRAPGATAGNDGPEPADGDGRALRPAETAEGAGGDHEGEAAIGVCAGGGAEAAAVVPARSGASRAA